MPQYRYTGSPGMYPQGRDTQDRPIGTVTTGDERDLDEAPDSSWVPAEPGVQEHLDAIRALIAAQPGSGVQMQAVEHPADGTWSPPVSNDGSSETPPDPEPGVQDDDTAGQPGSEEN